jgi:hypothetical protein
LRNIQDKGSVKITLKKFLLSILFLGALNVYPQVGGTKTYRFLDIPMTARAAALGGNSMSIWGDDINLSYSNPALLNPSMTEQFALNYSNYVGDMNFFHTAYGHDLGTYGTAGINLQAFNYGNFKGYDELGNATTDFKAADYSIGLNYARPLADSIFNVGIALKTIISQYDIYQSYGNAVDFGIVYHNKKDFTVSLLAKNVGVMWKTYNPGSVREELPKTVQLGLSKKVPRAPFRLIVVYDQLLKWNLRYVSPIDTAGKLSNLSSGETRSDTTSWQRFSTVFGQQADNFMRHIIVGAEILVTKNFNLRIAYNYKRQREMILPERRGAAALSMGVGFKVKRFGFSYAFSKLAVPGNSHMIGLTFGW